MKIFKKMHFNIASSLLFSCLLMMSGCNGLETSNSDVELTTDNENENNNHTSNGNIIGWDSSKTEWDGTNSASGEENSFESDVSDEEQSKQDHPYQVRYTLYDVDNDGNLSLYESYLVDYGYEMSFDWCSYVVFEDINFEKEIDPNQKIKLEDDIVVYRRDYYDKVPVFITVHYYINDMEYIWRVDHRTLFRGKILNKSNLGGDEYEYYRGPKGTKMFESGVEVIREEDDKLEIYAYRDDPLFHKVTFKIGTNEIGSLLAYEGYVVGRYSAMDLGGPTQYEILDCDAYENSVTSDITVTITDYKVYHYVPITVYCCYKGDAKYSYVDYSGFDEEGRIEISEEMNLYTNAECTSRFSGYVTSASIFYSPISVDLS